MGGCQIGRCRSQKSSRIEASNLTFPMNKGSIERMFETEVEMRLSFDRVCTLYLQCLSSPLQTPPKVSVAIVISTKPLDWSLKPLNMSKSSLIYRKKGLKNR